MFSAVSGSKCSLWIPRNEKTIDTSVYFFSSSRCGAWDVLSKCTLISDDRCVSEGYRKQTNAAVAVGVVPTKG